MSEFESRTITNLVITMEADAGLQAREVITSIEALNFVIELCGAMAHPYGDTAVIPRLVQPHTETPYRAHFHELVHVRSLTYGSPFQLTIDLPMLLEFLQNAGLIAFTAMAFKAFNSGAEGWKNLEEAMTLRRERRASRSVRRSKGDGPPRDESTSEWLQNQRAAEEGIARFLEPLVRAIQEEGPKTQEIHPEAAAAAGRRYIEYHEEEAYEAGKTLKTKSIRIQLD